MKRNPFSRLHARAKRGLILRVLFFIGSIMAMMPAHADTKKGPGSEIASAVFAGGCFWCLEPPFDKLEGVIDTTSGYAGGQSINPTYKEVSSGASGHIEVVRIRYDPSKVDYEKLLEIFWRNIDPFDAAGQFCDKGEQYSSAIFTSDPQEIAKAKASKLKFEDRFKKPIATVIRPEATFYPAESYHQDYYKRNPARYKYYRWGCGRDKRLKAIWGNEAGAKNLLK